MTVLDRRKFFQAAVAGATGLAGSVAPAVSPAREADPPKPTDLFLAPFRFDVTPPMGHSLCGGWIKPVTAVDDALEGLGFVLLGAGKPIVLCLHLNEITLHLPAECFIEYQLRAQQMQPKRWIATAAYGDGGPWYIPTQEEYPHGGYEVSVAFCDPEVDSLLTKGMRTLLP